MDEEIKIVRRERLMERLKARLLAEAECKDMKLECKEVNATATEETQADLARMRAQMEAEVVGPFRRVAYTPGPAAASDDAGPRSRTSTIQVPL